MAESVADALENINMENEDDTETEDFSIPLSNPSNVASVSYAPSGGETSLRRKKRKATATDDMTKLIEKGLASVSDEMHKLVTVIISSSPNLESLDSLPNDLKDMGLNTIQVVRVSMYFGNNPTQLRIWKGLDGSFKPEFVKGILEEDNISSFTDDTTTASPQPHPMAMAPLSPSPITVSLPSTSQLLRKPKHPFASNGETLYRCFF
ncbi:hypothetical protein L6452_18377 [Arctium lappa]|uniref:Uncharacterized protein n=1 Tax=Arctium lappa TaxID=4217 RepID=A0ACB9C611_ARCLA|nr:hypothetical protein L6452_18377 [Arctium lappa]